MTRVEELRTQETAELIKQVGLAIRRLKRARTTRPEINHLDGCYPDGSYRDTINDTGGFVRPLHHTWKVGRVANRDVYVYELIDWGAWTANVTRHTPADIDTGTYQLAVSDPSKGMYQNRGMYVGSWSMKELKKVDWAVELIMGVTDLAKSFYLPSDLDDRITRAALS